MSDCFSCDCFEFYRLILQGTTIHPAVCTKGTFAHAVFLYMSEVFCEHKKWVTYFKDAMNLVIQKDFNDPDKVIIFNNILTIKESAFDLQKSDIFTISEDLNERIGLLRLFEALSQGKLQSISDCKKVVSFLGIEDVKFYSGVSYFAEHPSENAKYLVHPLYSEFQNYKDIINAWFVDLPSYLIDEQYATLRKNVEAFFNKIKKPSQTAYFPYTLQL